MAICHVTGPWLFLLIFFLEISWDGLSRSLSLDIIHLGQLSCGLPVGMV